MMIKTAIKIVCSLFLMGIVVFSVGYAVAEEKQNFAWGKYPEPFTEDIFVSQVGSGAIQSPTLEVNLPQNLARIGLMMCIQSDVEGSFSVLHPYLTVGGQKYPISVKNDLGYQEATVILENLAAGKTILTFSFGWVGGWSCLMGETCGYTIHTLAFTSAPPANPGAHRKPGATLKP